MVEKIGKYSIIEKIGVGGFGEVYKGYDPFIKRHIAVKTCNTTDQEIRNRFFQEAEIAGNLNHRNITTVYDFGIQDNLPYLIQEYLSGEDLDRKIKRKEFLPFPEKLYYLLQIARGLAYAHANGVIHRDIKPANIRILEDGTAKIMDFGIAKLAQQETGLTQTGMTLGTAAYLAPEQVRGDSVDHRTDLFSYGVLAYELLTYQRPFQGKQISTVLYEILNNTPRPIQELWPEAPPSTAALIERCLQKDIALRPRDGNDLLRELEAVQKEGRSNQARYEDGPTIQLTGPEARALTDPPVPPPHSGSEPLPAEQQPRPAVETTPSQATQIGAVTTPHRSVELLDRPAPTEQFPESSFADLPSQRSNTDSLDDIVFAGDRERDEISSTGRVQKSPSSFGGIFLLLFLAALAGGVGWWFGNNKPGAETEEVAETPEDVVDLAPEDVEPPPGTESEPPPQPAAPIEEEPEPEEAAPIPATVVVPFPEWTEDIELQLGGRTWNLDRRRQLSLPPGTYTATFRLQLGDYETSRSTQVKLGDGERVTLASPIPQPGSLSVRPLPARPQGKVRLGSEELGSSPIRQIFIAPGEHTLEILPASGEGEAIAKSFTVEPAQEIIVSFDLDQGQISIRTKDPTG